MKACSQNFYSRQCVYQISENFSQGCILKTGRVIEARKYTHSVLYQFQMPIEENVSEKIFFAQIIYLYAFLIE